MLKTNKMHPLPFLCAALILFVIFSGNAKLSPFDFEESLQVSLALSVLQGPFLAFPSYEGVAHFAQLPFFSWILALWIKIFGDSNFALRLLPALVSFASFFTFLCFYRGKVNTENTLKFFPLLVLCPLFFLFFNAISPFIFCVLFSIPFFFSLKNILENILEGKQVERKSVLFTALGLTGCLIFGSIVPYFILMLSVPFIFISLLFRKTSFKQSFIASLIPLKSLFISLIFCLPFFLFILFSLEGTAFFQQYGFRMPIVCYWMCQIFGENSLLCNVPVYQYLFYYKLGHEETQWWFWPPYRGTFFLSLFLLISLLLKPFILGFKSSRENIKKNIFLYFYLICSLFFILQPRVPDISELYILLPLVFFLVGEAKEDNSWKFNLLGALPLLVLCALFFALFCMPYILPALAGPGLEKYLPAPTFVIEQKYIFLTLGVLFFLLMTNQFFNHPSRPTISVFVVCLALFFVKNFILADFSRSSPEALKAFTLEAKNELLSQKEHPPYIFTLGLFSPTIARYAFPIPVQQWGNDDPHLKEALLKNAVIITHVKYAEKCRQLGFTEIKKAENTSYILCHSQHKKW